METVTGIEGKQSAVKKRNRLRVLACIALALAALTVWALYAELTAREYTITSAKLPEGASVRIVLISDLHSHIYGKDQKPLLDMIKEKEPDIIALAGDIVDDGVPQAGAKLFLQSIADIAPAYYVSGNHEYWSGKCDEIKEMIKGYGVTVLGNGRELLTVNGVKLCICGVDDPEVFKYTDDKNLLALSGYEELLRRFAGLDDDTVNILLAHRPEYIEDYGGYGFDAVLSGHTHGGQIRVPLLINGVFAPDQGWMPRYAGGLYEADGTAMIVSRGLSFNDKVPRVFNPPEVVVMEIKGEVK